jgi:hypothetical protein
MGGVPPQPLCSTEAANAKATTRPPDSATAPCGLYVMHDAATVAHSSTSRATECATPGMVLPSSLRVQQCIRSHSSAACGRFYVNSVILDCCI